MGKTVVAVVGRPNVGKSTLLKILAGLMDADGGSYSLSKGLSLGYMEQQFAVHGNETVYEILKDVFTPVFAMEEKLRQMEVDMASTQNETELKRLGDSYERLNFLFEQADGYAWQSSIAGVLAGLGFEKHQWDQPAALLSGGELTRLCLAKLLLQKPDLLLLDEPTNHLDLESITALNNALIKFKGALLFTSHDHQFVQSIADRIIEFRPDGIYVDCTAGGGGQSQYHAEGTLQP